MGEPISIITNWAKLNQGKSQIRAASMKAFQSFQESVLYVYEAETIATDLTRAEECRLTSADTCTSGEGSSEGLYILLQYKLGRTGYTSLRHDLKPRVELPTHYKLMQHKNAIMPTIWCYFKPYQICCGSL